MQNSSDSDSLDLDRDDNNERDNEAWVVANGIVDELLKDIFIHTEKITGILKGFERRIKMNEGIKEDTNACPVDVFQDSMGDTEHDMIITGFSHRHSPFQIIQLSVAKQHKGGYCGHHALHNALLARKMCQASSADEMQELMKIMRSTPAYWWQYWLSVKQLLGCVSFDTWWPWTEDHIATGDMERNFLHYLLDQYHPANSDPPILVLQYAYGFMQDSVSHIKKLHEAIMSFRQSGRSSRLIFILGITNHWVSVLITKENKKHSVSLVYFDSCNEPIVTYTDEDIIDHMKKKEAEKIKKKGKGWTAWEHEITKQSYMDQRDVVHMLASCAAGSSDLCNEMINGEVNKITQSFKISVINQWKALGGSNDDLLLLLLNWTQSYTPNSIHGGLIKILSTFGNKCMSESSRKSLDEWINFIDSNKLMDTDFTQLLSFYSVVDTVKNYL